MKVLVTGGTGFAGYHLCRRLVEDGHRVVALARQPAAAGDLAKTGVEIAGGDLSDPESLKRALAGVEMVYHLAAVFRRGDLSAARMHQINAQGTWNLLDAAHRSGTVRRFVHCSTVGVHGDTGRRPADEEAPLRPGDAYQRSKLEGELAARAYGQDGRLAVVIFRPGGIYGPRDRRFLKLFRAISRGRFVMLGSGEVLYQMIYIDDLVDGILLCGTRDEALGRTYILTGERPVTLNHLIAVIARVLDVSVSSRHWPVMPAYLAGMLCELICRPLGVDPPVHRRRVDFFRKSRSFTIDRAEKELGFRPRTDLETGIRRTVAWYRKEGYL
jgi:dihydroflavonol-4-reductase